MVVFDNVKGYAFDQIIKTDQIENKISASIKIISSFRKERILNILIAGCGKGDEAFAFYKQTSANIYGIDINAIPYSKSDDNRIFEIKKESLNKLSFANEKFDIIYCYHVLEHVNEPFEVLKELKRVLSSNGILFIGFPNRSRILPGYLSSHINISFIEIVKFNCIDYKKRLTGRFRNEFGAHAGFSEQEFFNMSNLIFKHTSSIRKKWIELNYPGFIFILKMLEKLKLDDYFYPSNYFIVKK